ncbi:MAG: ComF family protein [Lentisphaeria bacterium]|jgi:ComF family protein
MDITSLKRERFDTGKHFARQLAQHLCRALLPSYCHLCGTRAAALLCDDCFKDLPHHQENARCRICDIDMECDAAVCGDCLKHPPSFDTLVTSYRFETPLSGIINRFKHQRGHYWADTLCKPLVAMVAKRYDSDKPPLLMPVPIHWRKRLTRGYNQSELLAAVLCKHLGVSMSRALKKTQPTKMQQGLGRKERTKNLRGSFECPQSLAYPHVVLVDDVVTTGATVEALAKRLKQQGVKRVDVWALARTPKKRV